VPLTGPQFVSLSAGGTSGPIKVHFTMPTNCSGPSFAHFIFVITPQPIIGSYPCCPNISVPFSIACE
jgi:hypothetical protein